MMRCQHLHIRLNLPSVGWVTCYPRVFLWLVSMVRKKTTHPTGQSK